MLKKNTSLEVSDRSRYWSVLVIKTAGSSNLVETASTEIDAEAVTTLEICDRSRG
jgi:hypothetical protein